MEELSPEQQPIYELNLDDLLEVCEPLGEEHTDFIIELDDVDDATGYLYGALAEIEIDPDEFMELSGIVEPSE